MKKLLLILNPYAGQKKANKYLTDILITFANEGYDTVVKLTKSPGDGAKYVHQYGKDSDLIVCIGGDGTFNEAIGGIVDSGCDKPLGYIPSGSTNDFARSLGLNKKIVDAANDIVTGKKLSIDIGKFNDRYFSYVASFGAFTKVSYSTSQSIKNSLGHMAYILEGIKELSTIHPEHVRIEANGKVYEDDYLFGAVCNSTSVGGILQLDKDYVDIQDGLFEVLLIKSPKNIIDLNAIVFALNNKDYSTDMITFFSTSSARITSDENMSWSLDGEFMHGSSEINMTNIHNAVSIMIHDDK